MHFKPQVGKAKMHLRGGSLFSIFKNLFTFFNCLFTIFQKKLPPLKPILALPTWGQKCLVSELWSFEIKNFDLGHPVRIVNIL